MFLATSLSGKKKKVSFKSKCYFFAHFWKQNFKMLLYFLTTNCSFDSRITAVKARPCDGMETLLGNAPYSWLGLAVSTKTGHHSPQTCSKEAVCPRPAHTCRQDGSDGTRLLWSTTIRPISATARDATSPRLPKRGALGSPWGFGGCQPSQVPTAPTRAEPAEGRSLVLWDGRRDGKVPGG